MRVRFPWLDEQGRCGCCGGGPVDVPADNKWGYVTHIQLCPVWCRRRIIDWIIHPTAAWGPWNWTRRLS